MSDPELLRVPSRFRTIEDVLETARRMSLTSVLVLGELSDGSLVYLEGPDMTISEANWLLDRMKAVLMFPGHFERRER